MMPHCAGAAHATKWYPTTSRTTAIMSLDGSLSRRATSACAASRADRSGPRTTSGLAISSVRPALMSTRPNATSTAALYPEMLTRASPPARPYRITIAALDTIAIPWASIAAE